jgi:hypothetical protein
MTFNSMSIYSFIIVWELNNNLKKVHTPQVDNAFSTRTACSNATPAAAVATNLPILPLFFAKTC